MNLSWFLDPIQKHYFDFKGRASRKQYWMFTLYSFLLSVVVGTIGGMINFNLLGSILSLALLLPSLGLTCRRLHDINKSAWWVLLNAVAFIAFIGFAFFGMLSWLVGIAAALTLLFFLVQKGDVGDNKYGADPLGSMTAAAPVTLQTEQSQTPPTTPTV